MKLRIWQRSGFKRGDVILFGIVLLFLASSGMFFLYRDAQPIPEAYLWVRDLETQEETVYPLYAEQDEVLEFHGPAGISRVYLQDGGAAIVYSDCPDQICVEVFGWIFFPGQASVCLPNRILIQVEAIPADR